MLTFWAATSGTWINVISVTIGTLIGVWVGQGLRPGLAADWRRWMGVITLLIGLEMAHPLLVLRLGPLPALLPALMVLVAGSVVGDRLGMERQLARWLGQFRPGGAAAGVNLVSGSFVLFCVGPLTLLGCLRNGALADPDLLLVKATLDGVSAAVLAATAGLALLWVLVPLALLQLGLSAVGATLAGGFGLADPATAPPVVFTAAVGGLLVLGLALELMELPHPSVTNALAGLALAPVLGVGMA